ncbi:MAG TPA: GNAT family N-acetyltransferase, partial [Myxococcota bacterium]
MPAIVRLLQQLSRDGSVRERSGDDPVYARAFAEIAGDLRQRIVVAEDGGVVVGTATLRVFANLSHGGRGVAQAESVVVDERVRGRGVGALLMQHL